MSILHVVIILIAGFIAGFINTLAGGGSFLTLAALNLVGLPLPVANASNRIAILAQNIMAVLGFRSKGFSDIRLSLHFAIPSLLGSILGAYVVGQVSDDYFKRFLGAMMLLMLITLIINPKKWLEGRPVEWTPGRRILIYGVFFLIGIYGGAIQAGVGILLIAAFVLTAGLDLVESNVHKVFVAGVFTVFALLTFALRGQVNWGVGLILAIGNALGGWFSSRLAVEHGQGLVRAVLAISLFILGLRYLGLLPF